MQHVLITYVMPHLITKDHTPNAAYFDQPVICLTNQPKITGSMQHILVNLCYASFINQRSQNQWRIFWSTCVMPHLSTKDHRPDAANFDQPVTFFINQPKITGTMQHILTNQWYASFINQILISMQNFFINLWHASFINQRSQSPCCILWETCEMPHLSMK